jgi:hypothetical protein
VIDELFYIFGQRIACDADYNALVPQSPNVFRRIRGITYTINDVYSILSIVMTSKAGSSPRIDNSTVRTASSPTSAWVGSGHHTLEFVQAGGSSSSKTIKTFKLGGRLTGRLSTGEVSEQAVVDKCFPSAMSSWRPRYT